MNQILVNETVLDIKNAHTEDMIYLQSRIYAYDLTPDEAVDVAKVIKLCPNVDLRNVTIRPADFIERIFHGIGFSYHHQTMTITFISKSEMTYPDEFAAAIAHEIRHADQNNRGYIQVDQEKIVWNDGNHQSTMTLQDYVNAANNRADEYFLAPWEADANAFSQIICGNYTADPLTQRAYSLAKFYY